ncbi:hypothetical protein [Pseudomonas plecoglossicida]|uniref:hypothetical protein n=1 Tax=Pseudomonas plecoglossicida TaxID=70775 RepID=UPI002159670F|nr:hypothetical protein [Pseudomonas plecoglossicida]MBA1321222.1 hypothetical protein [Pseudomonas plecoglossicida]
MIEATEKQLELLWHTLGIHPSCRLSSRNYFLTSPGYDDANNLDVLVAAGLMTCGKAPAFCPQDDVVYRATDEGKRFASEKLPPPPTPRKYTRFDAYLAECECYDGFAQFLGINQPQIQQRGGWGNYKYRMVRYPRGSAYCEHRRPTRFAYWSPYESLEVAGEWAHTMKAAKASYKEALRLHQAEGRAEKNRLAA